MLALGGSMRETESCGYRFGAFQLDPRERVLLCDGQRVPLARTSFDLLLLLVAQPGHTLSKRELMGALWPYLAVHTNSLPVAVNAVAARSARPDRADYRISTPACLATTLPSLWPSSLPPRPAGYRCS
jgi:DNA-binding winged helix-turn-helix (wHTH) protein